MKSFSKIISLFMALLMITGMIAVTPISASAADSSKQAAAVEDNVEEVENSNHAKGKEVTGNQDENDPDDNEEETLPEGDMAKPVSLTVEPIEIYEDLDVEAVTSYNDDGDEVKWRQYQFSDKIIFTVDLEDGTKLESDEYGSIEYNDEDFDIEFNDNQSFNNQWGVGAHSVEFSILGLKTNADVTILASPIDHIEFKDITCTEGTNGVVASYSAWDPETDSLKFQRCYYRYDNEPQFTVTLTDGDEIQSESGGVEIAGERYIAKIYTQQYLDPWTVGSRKLTAELFGKDYELYYTINESDIKSISVDDVTLFDGIDSSQTFYYMYGEKIPYNCFNYSPEITITLNDGTELHKTLDDETIKVGNTEYSISKWDDQDDDNEWTAGIHKAYVFVGAKQQEINVTVVENPIDQINVSDTDVYYGVGGDWVYALDDDDFWFKYSYTPDFSVKLKDGTELTGENGAVTIDGREYALDFEDDQSFDKQWEPDKEYTVSARSGAAEAEFKARVRNDTVKSVKLLNDNITVQLGTDSYIFNNEDKGYKKLNYCKYVQLAITMYDGTVVYPDEDGCYWFEGNELEVEFSDDQSEENVWDAGVHQASAKVLNASVSFDVTVIGNPVSEVKIKDIKIIQGIHFDKGCYYYSPEYSVVLNNGNVLKSDLNGHVWYNNDWYNLNIDDGQRETPWGVGKHKVKGTILGVSAEFEVDIIPSPVENVAVEPMSLIENASGLWKKDYDEETDTETDEYFYYYSNPAAYTVTLKDGTVLESDEQGDVYYEGECYSLTDVVDNQSFGAQWTKGNTYNCKASVMGFEFDYQVNVTASPVKSVNASLTLIEGSDDSVMYDDDDKERVCYGYDEDMVELEVTLNNGEVLRSKQGYVDYNGESFGITNAQDDQSAANQWKPGNTYTIAAEFMGCPINVNVNVISSPIKSVKVNSDYVVIDNGENDDYLRDYYEGEKLLGVYRYYGDLNPLDYTVTFSDGKTVKSDENGFITYAGRSFALLYDEYSTNQDYYNQWTVGNTYTASGSIMGYKVSYKVRIMSGNEPTSISLKIKKNKIYVGDTITVEAQAKNPKGKTKFVSSNKNVASVNAEGKVKAIKSGRVTITVTNNGKSASVKITVKKKANTMKVKARKAVKAKAQEKTVIQKAVIVKKAKGKLSFKTNNKKVKIKSIDKLHPGTCKMIIGKGLKKGKTYQVKVTVSAMGSVMYKSCKKTITIKVKVE